MYLYRMSFCTQYKYVYSSSIYTENSNIIGQAKVLHESCYNAHVKAKSKTQDESGTCM